MSIQIFAIGKKHEPWIIEGVERYQKRLKRPYDIEWVFLPHSVLPNDMARQEESERIISRLNANDYVILLDERGKNIDSPDLSTLLRLPIDHARRVVVVIGGAYGVDDSVQQRADYVWSLSKLVFPHQLVRLILVEQIYRAQEIFDGKPYHHV